MAEVHRRVLQDVAKAAAAVDAISAPTAGVAPGATPASMASVRGALDTVSRMLEERVHREDGGTWQCR
jgi:hypothetical protein